RRYGAATPVAAARDRMRPRPRRHPHRRRGTDMIRMPNRISVRPGDRGFMDPAVARDIVVLCDGEPLRGCRAADRKRGIAWCYVLDPRGRVVDDPDRPGHALEVVVRGR